jgi:hypothetical protein
MHESYLFWFVLRALATNLFLVECKHVAGNARKPPPSPSHQLCIDLWAGYVTHTEQQAYQNAYIDDGRTAGDGLWNLSCILSGWIIDHFYRVLWKKYTCVVY